MMSIQQLTRLLIVDTGSGLMLWFWWTARDIWGLGQMAATANPANAFGMQSSHATPLAPPKIK